MTHCVCICLQVLERRGWVFLRVCFAPAVEFHDFSECKSPVLKRSASKFTYTNFACAKSRHLFHSFVFLRPKLRDSVKQLLEVTAEVWVMIKLWVKAFVKSVSGVSVPEGHEWVLSAFIPDEVNEPKHKVVFLLHYTVLAKFNPVDKALLIL